MIRLGVNIDHVATLRNVRGEVYPDPIQAALEAELGGASNITCHLREDRRHIRDRDVDLLKSVIKIPINLEMAATNEMVEIALKVKPHAVTLVPEKRQELTTEGGLTLDSNNDDLYKKINRLKDQNIMICLFVEPESNAIESAKKLGADAIEIHTGKYCHDLLTKKLTKEKFQLTTHLSNAANLAHQLELQVHVGHGLNYENAMWMQHVTYCQEANIGHAIIARSVFVGLRQAIREMVELLNNPNLKP